MAKITICNMVASRRRSASDLFLENGIWILKSHLKEKGHTVEPLDLATNSFYKKISPILLSRFIRGIYAILFRVKKTNPKARILKVLFIVAMLLQHLNSAIRKQRMKNQLARIANRVAENKDRIFGIKVWYGEAFTWANELSRMIHKKSPSTITIAGGYHPSLYETDFMDLSSFDLAVTGEGEQPLDHILNLLDKTNDHYDRETVLDLIRESVKHGDITNILIRDKKNKHKYIHNRVYPKILEKAIPQFYIDDREKIRVHILVDSLGCAWGQCHFCVHSKFFKTMAPRKPANVVNEIQDMTNQGIGLFRFSGSDTYPAFGAQIARKIIDSGLNIRYTIGARAIKDAKDPKKYDKITDQYEMMIKSGLRSVFMGGETGNDWVNKHVMNKGIGCDDIRWTLRAIRAAEKRTGIKIYVGLALIYPTPTLNTIPLERVFEDNLKLVRATQPDSVMVTPPSPFKQSTWYKQRKKFGFNLDQNFVRDLIAYEYVLFKPTELWQDIGIHLDQMDFKAIIRECGRMRKAIEDEGIETDVTDEQFLMQIAAGYSDKNKEFKQQNLLDIISGDYRWSEQIGQKINAYSKYLAHSTTN